MTVEVRLFASLRKYLPSGSGRASVNIDIHDGASIVDILTKLGIPTESRLMTLVDGVHERDLDRQLEDGCTLSIFPPIAGGA